MGFTLGQEIIEALRRKQQREAMSDAVALSQVREPLERASATITPQQAPLSDSPLRSPDLAEQLRQEYMGGTPAQREAYLRSEIGDAYDVVRSPAVEEFRALSTRGPTTHKPSGFWSRAKDTLVSAGLGARRGGADPIAALGGAIGGAVGGAIDPNLAHRLRYEDVELPQAYQKARAEQEVLGEDISRAMRVAGISGVDPYTGKSTLAAERAQSAAENAALRNEIAANRAASYAESVKSLVDARTGRLDIAKFNAQLKAWSQGGVALPELRARARTFGVELPEKYDPKKHALYYDEAGRPHAFDLVTGLDVGTGTAPTGSLQGRRQTEVERHNAEIEAIQRAREKRVAAGAGSPKITKVDVQVAVTEEWIKAGQTPNGLKIEDGNIVENYTRTPIEQHPEYKRAVNKRYSEATKKPAPQKAAGTETGTETITKAQYDELVRIAGGDSARVDAAMKRERITIKQ